MGPDTFFVTAPYRLTFGEWPNDRWIPAGEVHARHAGSGRTACGLVALEWPIFWGHEFEPGPESCRGCLRIVGDVAVRA